MPFAALLHRCVSVYHLFIVLLEASSFVSLGPYLALILYYYGFLGQLF